MAPPDGTGGEESPRIVGLLRDSGLIAEARVLLAAHRRLVDDHRRLVEDRVKDFRGDALRGLRLVEPSKPPEAGR